MTKRKVVLTILCSAIAVALIVLAVLVYIPRTTELVYDMRGFVISPDGQIMEEFTLTATGKSEEFILDQLIRKNKHTEDGILVERDNFYLDFVWDSSTLLKNATSGQFGEHIRLANTQYILGSLLSYSSASGLIVSESGMFDLENGALCLYADNLVENAFIVGVSDSDANPMTVLESYLKIVKNPATQSPSEN